MMALVTCGTIVEGRKGGSRFARVGAWGELGRGSRDPEEQRDPLLVPPLGHHRGWESTPSPARLALQCPSSRIWAPWRLRKTQPLPGFLLGKPGDS